jgi:hypothetical protein
MVWSEWHLIIYTHDLLSTGLGPRCLQVEETGDNGFLLSLLSQSSTLFWLWYAHLFPTPGVVIFIHYRRERETGRVIGRHKEIAKLEQWKRRQGPNKAKYTTTQPALSLFQWKYLSSLVILGVFLQVLDVEESLGCVESLPQRGIRCRRRGSLAASISRSPCAI